MNFFHILDAPIISLTFGKNINSSAVQENEDVYLDCNVRADPWITRIRWLHNVSINLQYVSQRRLLRTPCNTVPRLYKGIAAK